MSVLVTKAAVDRDGYRVPKLFYTSAREGFEDFLKNLPERPVPLDGVLLPAFIGWSPREGSGVFDPIRSLGARHGFYELNTDLTVNLNALEASLRAGRYRVLVVIHYYGRSEPNLAAIRGIANRYDAILVEDLAHGFFTAAIGGVAGHIGDVCIFSVHKMFPMKPGYGGIVAYRTRALLRGQQETAPDLARAILDYDWVAIARVRRMCYRRTLQRLQASPFRGTHFDIVWTQLTEYDVPQSMPVTIRTGDRDRVYHEMNARGYGMVSLYHTLIDEVQDMLDMQRLARTIINFPVHQDVNLRAIDGMVAAFEEAIQEPT